jgi:flagellar biosynthesis anti-sigma factor FlgM
METYQSPQLRKSVQKRGNTGRDEIQISSEGKYFDHVKKLAAQIPEVREDKVAEMAKKLENGKLNIPAATVAQRMLETV